MACVTELPVVCPNDGTIQVTKGDTISITVNLGVDLTGKNVTLTVKRSPSASEIILLKTGTIVGSPTDGKVKFDFVPADTENIPAGFYYFTITTDVAGTNVETILTGQFILQPIDTSFTSGKLEPIMQLAITGSTERITIETRDKDGVLANPSELSLQVLDFCDQVIVNITTISGIANPQSGIFYYDLTSNRAGDFLVIWSSRFIGEEQVKTIKNVRFVTPAMFRMIPEVLAYIDKSRKCADRTIAFTAMDVAIYIENALRDFNATTPSTDIKLENINHIYKEVLVQGSIIQAIIAQGLLAVDQDFQYNDNGIALTIDHNSKLIGWYQQLLQGYVAKKHQYKPNFFQPHAFVRTIVGSTFVLGFSKIPAGSASRFRGWI